MFLIYLHDLLRATQWCIDSGDVSCSFLVNVVKLSTSVKCQTKVYCHVLLAHSVHRPRILTCVLIAASEQSSGALLSSLMRWKSRLADLIQPDLGLMNELLGLEFLTNYHVKEVNSEETSFIRNNILLELVTSDNQCAKFLTALQRTGQQHIIEFISRDGGQVL